MRTALGIIFVLLWPIYLGQLLSVVNLPLAERLHLQHRPGPTLDPLEIRLEQGTAWYDLVSLWVLPAAGILMLVDHSWWPAFALIGGVAFVDAGGREALRLSGMRNHGVAVGTPNEYWSSMVAYAVFVILGGLGIAAGLIEIDL